MKQIEVNSGHALSLQYHERKHETMFLISGKMELTLGDELRTMKRGEFVDIPPGTIHRVRALTDVTILETSTPFLDDVVRLSDDYGREGTSTA